MLSLFSRQVSLASRHTLTSNRRVHASIVCLCEKKQSYGREEIGTLLHQVSKGDVSPDDALHRLRNVFDEHVEEFTKTHDSLNAAEAHVPTERRCSRGPPTSSENWNSRGLNSFEYSKHQ